MDYIQSDYIKEMKCVRNRAAIYYDTQRKNPLSVEHIMAIMIYCDWSDLCSQFSATFRRSSNDETMDCIKDRHRNFYWFGRYLKECVECFGIDHDQKRIRPYHGISRMMNFQSVFNTKGMRKGWKIPTSTTKQYTVAQQFTVSDGIILQLNINPTRILSHPWISRDEDGQERLIVGSRLRICEITIKNQWTGFVPAIQMFENIVNGQFIAADTTTQNILYHLGNALNKQHRVKIKSKYISKLFEHMLLNCRNITNKEYEKFIKQKSREYAPSQSYRYNINGLDTISFHLESCHKYSDLSPKCGIFLHSDELPESMKVINIEYDVLCEYGDDKTYQQSTICKSSTAFSVIYCL